jgi:hypothetical protein
MLKFVEDPNNNDRIKKCLRRFLAKAIAILHIFRTENPRSTKIEHLTLVTEDDMLTYLNLPLTIGNAIEEIFNRKDID